MLKCVLPDRPAWNEFRAVKNSFCGDTAHIPRYLGSDAIHIFLENFSLLSGAHIQRNASIIPTLS